MGTDHVEAPALVDPAVASDHEAIADVVPASIMLVEALYRLHGLAAIGRGVTGCRFVRVVDDHERNRTREFVHRPGWVGTPDVA